MEVPAAVKASASVATRRIEVIRIFFSVSIEATGMGASHRGDAHCDND
jgi:hypothetical protein